MFHVIGIDAGATKTACLLADAGGHVVARSRGGGANLQMAGELEVEKVLHSVIAEVLADRDVTLAAICLGMAGVDRETDARVMQAIMRRLALRTRTLIVNDALVALVAGVGDGPGVVVIAGTGSIAYGRDARNRAARSGGWGHVLGDEGSGHWIGRAALAAVVRCADGRGPATALTSAVLRHFQLAQVSDLVRLIYDRGLALPELAALGAEVQRARDEGDEVAARILDQAATELVTAAVSVVDRLEMRAQQFPFVLAGGMFELVPWLAEAVTARLAALADQSWVQRLSVEPATGAVRLALAEARGGASLPSYV